MSFADKKGITVASGFKLQAGALLDAREQVDTIADRDELVRINAVTEGLKVYVKETKTLYVYNGTGWDELSKGQGYVHPDAPGYKHIPTGGKVGQILKNKASGEAEWADEKDYTEELASKVPTSRKINNKPLTADVTLAAADVGAIPTTEKGAASGVASLDETGKVPAAQLPSYVDDVLEFENKSAFPQNGESGKIYVDMATNKTYRWSGSAYTEIAASLALGETASTAFPGDKGKMAYDHSQAAHAPANAQKNVQADWNESDPEADSFIKNKPEAYQHPENHPASMITQDTAHRFVSDTEKEKWNNKPEVYFASELPSEAAPGSLCFLIK